MLPNGHFRFALRLASALLIAAIAFILFPAAAHASCASPANAIEAENCLPGTPQAQWDISAAGDPSIQGFATDISVNAGGTVSFKINTTATQYHLDIYRMGYYQGNGARLIAGKALNTAIVPSVTLPQTQPACITDAPTNLVDCGNWAVSASWAVPANAVSGIYFAQLVRDDTVGTSHIVFIVRNDSSTSPILFQTADETWQAYNDFGGHSLYGPAGVFNNNQRAYKASYNRPFNTRSLNAASWMFYAEYPMVRWLEANGYNVTYFTSVDAARSGSSILNHKLYMTAGHDEYWSGPKRTNIEAARAAGVHLGFFTGNGGFWKTRWENSIDGSNTAYRTLVSYKETLGETKIDPLDPPTWTGTWRDPTFSPPADGGKPENALTGTLFRVSGCGPDNTDLSVQVPAADGKMRFWRNTTVAGQTTGQVFTLPAGTLGYEWDVDEDNGFRPAGLFRLSTGTYSLTTDYLIDYGETYAAGTATHHSTLYKASSKSLVFGAGTVQWSWGLDNHHDTYCGSGPYVTDANMQQATVNLLADMGIQPATLQGGLLTASASADTTRPASTITSPASGAKVQPGATVTIQGTAADTGGGVVGGVEVSMDGGTTWHPAAGRESWSYAWTVTGTGSITLRSRAVDDSGNLESPAAGVTVNISAPSCPCTIWPSTTTPGTLDSGDPNPYELGVKFTADFDGTITGIRFYKSTNNTGTHIGNLWSAAGSLLGSVTFTGEGATGWQQMNFTTPIAVTANTVYVVSYSTNVGGYSVDANYFGSNGVDNPPLHALQNGVSGGNGVYATPGVFPTNTFNSANYWVDLVYMPTSTKTLVSIAVAPVNPTLQIGHTQSFTATGTYSDGSKTDITSQVTWSSSNTSVATVSAGVATGVAGGTANITATLGLTSGYSTVTVQSAALAITTTALPSGAVNVPYSATLGATGGVQPYTWSLAAGSSLPAGLTLSPSGQLSGIPLIAATSTFTVQVKDAGVQEGALNPQQTATKSVSITISIPAFFTIWPSTAAPVTADAGDTSAVEVGVRFQADTGGVITGIRFYKSASNTGTHVGNLWTNTGSLLATATFTNESASGWQQVSFSSPVTIVANTVYVASYHTTVGHYAADGNYFGTAAFNSPPLHALQNGVSAPNGIYTYDITAGCTPTVQPCFPASSFNSANYWVDVVFQNTFGISGTISGAGGNGATVTASAGATVVATATANASGVYNLTGLGDGTYTVTPSKTGYTYSPASQSVTVNNGNATANFTTLYSISGTIAGIGGNGATVTLSGAASATVIANASGVYSFAGLANGAYTVTPSNTGFTFSPASQAVTINNANGTANFSTLFSIAGTITPAAASVGATVTATGPATGTSPVSVIGNYQVNYLPSGSYTVTPTKPGFGFTPASQTVSSNGAPVTGVNFTATVVPTIDATVATDSGTATTSITSPTFSTTSTNELLLAFIASDGNTANLTVTGVTGASLTWALVQRTNTQLGTAEIWRAFAPSALTNVSVKATLSQSVAASITVVSFIGANPSGTNGSGAIGATASGSAATGAPTASLVTTQNNSWVFGVGSDYDKATARTLGPNQTMVHQYVATAAGSTFWVQRQNSFTPLKGTTVTINDTAPTADRYDLSICEIIPAPNPWVLSGTISGGGAGATVTLSGTASATTTADASGNYSFSGLNNGTYTVTPSNTGFKYTPASQTVTINSANLAGVNFTGVATYSISGSISPAAMGSGATVALSGAATATTTADASGNYTFTGLLNGAYTVTPSKTGFTFTPANQAGTINSASLTGVNFSAVTYSISGTISGPGGSGATVSVTGAMSASATADASGNYTVSGLANGAYRITPSNPTFAFTPASQSVTVASANLTGMNFSSSATYGVSGTISGPGSNGATVNLAGAATVSGSSNMALYSQFDAGTLPGTGPWTYYCDHAAFTANTGDVADPWGGNTALKMVAPASGTTCTTYTAAGIQQPVPGLAVGQTYSLSVYARGAVGGEKITLRMTGAGNTCGPNTTYVLTTAWVRYSCTVPAYASGAGYIVNMENENNTTVYLAGAQLEPRSSVGTYVHTTSAPMTMVAADASGNYAFAGLANGAYTVTPSNTAMAYTPASQPATVNNANVTGLNFSTVTYSISGTISGAGGNAATVSLTGTSTATVTADASGNYTFSGLLNGPYTVTPSRTGFAFTPASQNVTVTSANLTAVNFGTVTYTISGTISGAGGNGATVNLTGAATATTTADASGNYTFSGLANGAYTVTPTQTGFTFTPASQAATISNANVTTLNFSTVTYTISGTISGPGGSGATVSLTGTSTATVTADASGNYTFTGLTNGAYTVTPSKTGITYTPASQPATIGNANVTALNFSTVTYSISGNISGTGGNGATVKLTGAATATVTADTSGNFAFSGLVNGAYTVTPSNGAFTFNPPNQAVTINSANVTGVTFASVAPTTFSISGTISGSAGNAATVTLSGSASASTTADASGNFTFSNLNNGSYTVTPSKAGYIFTPANKAVTVSGASVTAVNFTSTAQLAIDKTASTDRSSASTSLVSPAFTTTSANELLLAFVSSDATSAGITVTQMTGGSLTWTLVKRTNTQLGTSEIWRAFSPAILTNATVTATLSQSVAASITVVTFKGVDTSGSGGSGAIGATGTGNSAKGAPTASLTTTRNNSWVIGVGNDYDSATSRTVPTGQTSVHQYLSTTGDTFWVQRQTSTAPASGAVVTINDTAPTGDRYNLSLCEVLPAQ